MKVEDLKNLGLDDEIIKKVQALSGADVTAAKNAAQTQIDGLTSQVSDLQGQITQRDNDIKSITEKLDKAGQSATKLGELQQNLSELQNKYDTETQAYQTKLNDQKYEFIVREKANAVDFSCKAAKNEFISDLMKNRLPLSQDNDLLGFEDYTAKQREADPEAFKVVKKEEEETKPNFAPPNNPNSNPNNQKSDGLFQFHFTPLRKQEN